MIIGSAEVLIEPTSRGFAQSLEADLTPGVTSVAKRLGGIVAAAISVREIGQFFKSTVDAASDTVESVNKVATVFGESADEVERFAESADVLGLANQQALEAAGGFGNLFSAMGLADEKSAEMSTTLAGLAGDLASFQNTSVEEALQALTSGIVGETEPLRKYAVTINEGRIQQEALAQGLTDGTGALDAQTKALAIYGLIMQDTANAQGDALKTGGDLAGQQRQLTAEWSNAKAEIGAGLLPAVLEMVEATRGDLLPTVVDLAESAVPLLIEGFEAAEPLLGTTTTIVQTLAPALEAVADIIDAIPEPILSVATYGFAASRALGFASDAAGGLVTRASDFAAIDFSGRLDDSGRAAGAAEAGFSKLNIAVGLATLAVGAGVSIYNDATESAREYAGQVDEVALSMESVVRGQRDVNETIDEFLAKRGLSDDALSALDTILGPDAFGQIRDSILAGNDALDPFRESIRQIGVDLEGLDVGKLDNPDSDRGHIPREVAEAYGIERRALQDLIGAIEDYDQSQQEGTKQTIDSFIRTGELTQAQVDAAAAQAGLTEEGTNWVEVASILGGRVAEVVGVTDDLGGVSSRATGPIRDVTAAMEAQREVAEGVLDSLEEIAAAQLEAYSSTLRYESATNDFSDSLLEYETKTKEAAEAHREFGSSSAAAYAASIDLRDASIDVREAALGQAAAAVQLAEDQATAEGRTLSFNESQRIQRQEIQKVAESMAPGSPIRNELLGLAESIDEVEGIHPISVTVDTAEAQARLDTLARTLNDLYRATGQDIRISEGGGGGLILGAADGFAGTVSRPTMFMTGEGGEPEDVLVVPQSLGGVSRVVGELASALQSAGPFGPTRSVHMENHFHISDSNDGRSTAMKISKRLNGAGFRGGLSALVD